MRGSTAAGRIVVGARACNACSGTPRCAVVTSAAFACWLTTFDHRTYRSAPVPECTDSPPAADELFPRSGPLTTWILRCRSGLQESPTHFCPYLLRNHPLNEYVACSQNEITEQTSGPPRHNIRTRTGVAARNHRRITAPRTRTFNHGAALVVRHVTIFGSGHGLQRAIIDESQHRTPERLIMAQH